MHYWRSVSTLLKLEIVLMITVLSSFSVIHSTPIKDAPPTNNVMARDRRSYTMGLHQLPCNYIGRRCDPHFPGASGCSGVCRPGKSIRRCRIFNGMPYCVPVRIV